MKVLVAIDKGPDDMTIEVEVPESGFDLLSEVAGIVNNAAGCSCDPTMSVYAEAAL